MRVGLPMILVAGLAFSLVGASHADTWKVFEIPEWEERTDLAAIVSPVLWSCPPMYILEDAGHTAHGQDPPVIHAPEPAGILAFFCGAAALGGFLRRVRSRHRHRFP